MGIAGDGPCVRTFHDRVSRRFVDADGTLDAVTRGYDPALLPVSIFNVAVAHDPSRPRFVVVRNSDDTIVAATNDPKAARAAARLLSL